MVRGMTNPITSKLLALAAQSEANAAGWENDRSEFARQAREFQLELAAKFRARAAQA
jgi:hypothetical protein